MPEQTEPCSTSIEAPPPEGRCNACCEPIHPAARICPRCRSAQTRSHWTTLGSVLKWVGSVTAVLSLIFAVLQLRTLVADRLNRDCAVRELLTAARTQADVRDVEGAWNLTAQAMALNPVSPEARSLQLSMALRRIRCIDRVGKARWRNVVEEIIPILHRGVGAGMGQQRGDVLAHLAEANAILNFLGDRWIDVRANFERAIAADAENVFARTWYGRWLMEQYADKPDSKAEVMVAIDHFRRAVANGREAAFARRHQVMMLAQYSHGNYTHLHPEIGLALLEIGQQLKKEAAALDGETYERLAESYAFLAEQWDHKADYFRTYPPGVILETFDFIYDRCNWSVLGGRRQPPRKLIEIEAALLEADGQTEKAASLVRLLLSGHFGRDDYHLARKLREVLWEKQGETLVDTLFIQDVVYPDQAGAKAGLKREDILLAINGRPVSDKMDWGDVIRSLPAETAVYPMTLLRGTETVTLVVPNERLGVAFLPCRVPKRLVQAAAP